MMNANAKFEKRLQFFARCANRSNHINNRSLRTLRDIIAVRTTNRSSTTIALATRHLLEQLSACLWRHNSLMVLHLFSLLPVSPLWELSLEVNSPAHGFCHAKPFGI